MSTIEMCASSNNQKWALTTIRNIHATEPIFGALGWSIRRQKNASEMSDFLNMHVFAIFAKLDDKTMMSNTLNCMRNGVQYRIEQ